MKFNQFKYFQLIFLKSIKIYLNNIENLSLWNKKKSKKSYFRELREYVINMQSSTLLNLNEFTCILRVSFKYDVII